MTIKTLALSPKADNDLVNIYQHTLNRWHRSQADDYIEKINDAFNLIAHNNRIGKDRSYIQRNLRAFILGSHVIYYRKREKDILVVRILHQSMDISLHLPQ